MPFTLPCTLALKPYVPVHHGAVQALEVEVEHANAQALHLRYRLYADLARIRIPQIKPSLQVDELWKHTCFEVFFRNRSGAGYYELNASPSTEWALYSFDDYRKGMARQNTPQPPAILVEQSLQRLTIDVKIDLETLPSSRAIALAAVIEHENGRLSHWALTHPASKPDFHHPDSFVLEL